MKNRIKALLNMGFFLMIILVIFRFALWNSRVPSALVLQEGWTVSIDGYDTLENVVLKEVSLKDFGLQALQRGDIVRMRVRLPEIKPLAVPVILIRADYSMVRVYLDGKKIQEENVERYENNKYIGSTYQYIYLPNDFQGKELLIVQTFSQNNESFQVYKPPLLGDYQAVENGFVKENIFPIGTGAFMVVFGIVFFLLTLFFTIFRTEMVSQMLAAIMSFNLGTYILCSNSVAFLFVDWVRVTELEFISFLLMFPLLLGTLFSISRPRLIGLAVGVETAISALTFLILYLHFSEKIYMNHMVYLFAIVDMASFLYLVIYVFDQRRCAELGVSQKLELGGCFFLGIVFVLEDVLYLLDMHEKIGRYNFLKIVIPAGSLLFVMTFLMTYLVYITESYARKMLYLSLTRFAYEDGLTGLSNRARLDKEMRDLEETSDDYCMISMDLNGLKKINDEMGHRVGDQYLRDFSRILLEIFSSDCVCGRIGGDEFLIIIRNIGEIQVKDLLRHLQEALKYANYNDPRFYRSVAYGYAFSKELPEKNSHDVYLQADQRMYENKRFQHQMFEAAK